MRLSSLFVAFRNWSYSDSPTSTTDSTWDRYLRLRFKDKTRLEDRAPHQPHFSRFVGNANGRNVRLFQTGKGELFEYFLLLDYHSQHRETRRTFTVTLSSRYANTSSNHSVFRVMPWELSHCTIASRELSTTQDNQTTLPLRFLTFWWYPRRSVHSASQLQREFMRFTKEKSRSIT